MSQEESIGTTSVSGEPSRKYAKVAQNEKLEAITAHMARLKESAVESSKKFDSFIIDFVALAEECSHLHQQLATVTTAGEMKMADLIETKTEYEQQEMMIKDLKDRLQETELKLAEGEMKMADLIETKTEYEQQEMMIKDLEDRLQEAELKLAEGEDARKKLHNTILELKGVFSRVLSFSPEDNC